MLKYVDVIIGLREIPDEICLAISISQCPFRCKNCHSPYLQEDVGELLTLEKLYDLIEKNKGITCVCLMGGSNEIGSLNLIMANIKKKYPNLKTAVYLGNKVFPKEINLRFYDYIKLGPYDEKLGGLDSPTTNQRLKKITWVDTLGFDSPILNVKDITFEFWK